MKLLIKTLLFTLLPVVAAAQAQQLVPFYFEGTIAGKPYHYTDVAPGLHAVICCQDEVELQGKDTLLTSRAETSSLYLRNYLAGEGLTLVLHNNYHQLPAHDTTVRSKKGWKEAFFTPGPKPFAVSSPAGLTTGVELRWKSPVGTLYTTATLTQPATSKFVLLSAVPQAGIAKGGFGAYAYVIQVELKAQLAAATGQEPIPIAGKLRIGLWQDADVLVAGRP